MATLAVRPGAPKTIRTANEAFAAGYADGQANPYPWTPEKRAQILALLRPYAPRLTGQKAERNTA